MCLINTNEQSARHSWFLGIKKVPMRSEYSGQSGIKYPLKDMATLICLFGNPEKQIIMSNVFNRKYKESDIGWLY